MEITHKHLRKAPENLETQKKIYADVRQMLVKF